ncbi:MAG: hypothetical protein AB7I32_07730 [Gammaproteobacteria bacterium]
MIAIPRRVFLFSGHLVDEAGRAPPRFPNDAATIARVRRALEAALTKLALAAGDLALTQGACGGDLLFSALCIERGVALRWLQPAREEAFIADSVARGGEYWLALYARLRAALETPPRTMPAVLGRAVDDFDDPYHRCNRWLLDTARAYGLARLHVVALWDHDPGDQAGGTAGMIEDARRYTRDIALIDLRALRGS